MDSEEITPTLMLNSLSDDNKMENTSTLMMSSLSDDENKENVRSITFDDYVILQELGKGAQGSVYKAINKLDGKVVAIKLLYVKVGSDKYYQAISEVDILEKISRPQCNLFLSCYYNHTYDIKNSRLIVEMEYIDGITMNRYCRNIRDQGDYSKLYKHLLLITKDIITAIKLIHDKDVIHNDIKPENILIDNNLTPKLVDFGVSCISSPCELNRTELDCCKGFSGTPQYASPEMLQSNVRYNQSDIWSLGVTLYFCATGTYPFNYPPNSNTNTILNITLTQTPKLLNISNLILNNIVNGCLIKDPLSRISDIEISNILN